MLSFDMNLAVVREQHKDRMRKAEMDRLAAQFGNHTESWFSRVAKLFVRHNRQERVTFNRRPVASPR